MECKQQQQKAQHDSHGKSRTFRIGDAVLLKNFTGPGWLPGKIIETSGPVSFHVLLDDGRCKRCHQDQLRPRVTDDGPPDMSEIPVTPTTPETGPEPELTNSDQSNVRTKPTTTSDPTESSDTSDSIDTMTIRTSVVIPVDNENLVKGLNLERLDIVYELSDPCVMTCMCSIMSLYIVFFIVFWFCFPFL